MIAIFMSFAGQFAFFTYIRPVYMNLAGFGVDGLTLVLLSFGIASFVGTSLSSFILKRSVKLALAGAPFVLALSALVLTLWGSDKIVATGVAIIWGLTFALIPVGWSTWITRSLADQAEKAGSIQVAVIQLANTCGAAIGGYALDNIGLTSPLMLSGTLMLLTALLVAVLTDPGILPYPTLPNNCSDYYVPSPRWPRVYVVYCFHLTTLTFPTLHLIMTPVACKFYVNLAIPWFSLLPTVEN